MGYKKFPGMGYKKFLGPGSSELVTGNSREKLSTFSPDFPVKNSWEFPRIPRKDSWEFPRIFRKIVTWVVLKECLSFTSKIFIKNVRGFPIKLNSESLL